MQWRVGAPDSKALQANDRSEQEERGDGRRDVPQALATRKGWRHVADGEQGTNSVNGARGGSGARGWRRTAGSIRARACHPRAPVSAADAGQPHPAPVRRIAAAMDSGDAPDRADSADTDGSR